MLTKQLALCRLHMTTLKFKQLKAKRNNNDFFSQSGSCSGHYFAEMQRNYHILLFFPLDAHLGEV